ncbi:MAG: FlgD immunoglobulin-like domain containing protein, partial [Propionicimonas sp.]|nr:FlgD immunoglobulin-like domain containing protein [Propionicimonas sp.]
RNGQYAVGSAAAAGGSYLVIGPVGPTGTAAAVEVPGLVAVDVSADRIHYLAGTADRLRLCRAEVSAPEAAQCTTIATGEDRDRAFGATLTTSDGADQVSFASEDGEVRRRWFVRGGRVSQVSTGVTGWEWLPYRDTEAPMAVLHPDGGEPAYAAIVTDAGAAEPLFVAPAVPSAPGAMALAADRVAYIQQRPGSSGATQRRTGVRSLSGNELGTEVVLADRDVGELRVSGDRTALQSAEEGELQLVFYDQLAETARVEPDRRTWLRVLSGPYALLTERVDQTHQQVLRADGHAYDVGQVMALFGSLVVEASAPAEAAGRTFALRDLERPGDDPVPVELPDTAGRVYRNTDWTMWGEWLHVPYLAGNSYASMLFNYRTGEAIELGQPARVLLGDGWALLVEPEGPARLRVLATGEEFQLDLDERYDVATDGARTVAWSGLDGAWVGRIEGLPAPVPRLLGTIGASALTADGAHTWAPQFDLTAPTAAGTLQVADAAGTVVARLPVAAATAGSIRGLSWDGRDASGELVAAGDYTWTLAVDAATSVGGLQPASGILTVTN